MRAIRWIIPRALVAGALVAGAATLAALASPGAASASEHAAGYDHVSHEGKVSAAGTQAIACTSCHRMDARGRLSGRPDHAACFGACHGPPPPPRRGRRPYAIPPGQQRLCIACHAPRDLEAAAAGQPARLGVAYPPYTRDPDYHLLLSHAAHDAAARAARDCATCHAPPGSTRPGHAHARCATCHLAPDTPPAMHDCQRCHAPAYGPRSRPAVLSGVYPVSAVFSHQRPAAHAQAGCRVCHDEVAAASSSDLPAPTKAACQACHDGAQAFSVASPQCRRCHTQHEPLAEPRPALTARYDHDRHRPLLADARCSRCHTMDARGAPRPPAADHAPCADAGCHAAEFSALRPTICGACHVGTEPWRPLHLDRPPRPDTEFGARFSHRAHLTVRGMERACVDCHREATTVMDMRLPRDHSACAGSGCHGQDAGTPPLSACEACHTPGLGAARLATRSATPWSVRARFRHAPHRHEPGTQRPVACASCHLGVDQAQGMDDIPAPGKAQCTPCHDGARAFKVTGHGCARCHGGSRPGTLPGESAAPDTR